MDIEEFKKKVRELRRKEMPSPRSLVEEAFRKSPYYEKSPAYILENVDDVLYGLRKECWSTYLEHERNFNVKVTDLLIENNSTINSQSGSDLSDPKEIIGAFLASYNNHLFELSKSNTNSRRSRAGQEFEIIVEKILLHIGIHFEDQSIIGSKLFERTRLGKLVDFVVPGALEYGIEGRKCSLVSMKTSLRERWQEVPEEMKRTGASEMFLLTLDKDITQNTIENLDSHNVTLVVPNDLKENVYQSDYSVYSLTQFLNELINTQNYWFERTDLSPDYYDQKLKNIGHYIKSVTDEYERNLYLNLRDHYLEKLKN